MSNHAPYRPFSLRFAVLFVIALYVIGVLICQIEKLPVDSTPSPTEVRTHAGN